MPILVHVAVHPAILVHVAIHPAVLVHVASHPAVLVHVAVEPSSERRGQAGPGALTRLRVIVACVTCNA